MEYHNLQDLFVDELRDMYSAERQLVQALPKFINAVSFDELREAIATHLKETENQVRRIEKIFSLLSIPSVEHPCQAMEGLISEAHELIDNSTRSAVTDAAIISAAQKIEHYEIASYGTLRSFAKQLSLNSDVVDLIQDSLDEEGSADKLLTKIADGSFFTTGVNKVAAES